VTTEEIIVTLLGILTIAWVNYYFFFFSKSVNGER
jgi:hypothetical protein